MLLSFHYNCSLVKGNLQDNLQLLHRTQYKHLYTCIQCHIIDIATFFWSLNPFLSLGYSSTEQYKIKQKFIVFPSKKYLFLVPHTLGCSEHNKGFGFFSSIVLHTSFKIKSSNKDEIFQASAMIQEIFPGPMTHFKCCSHHKTLKYPLKYSKSTSKSNRF